MPVEAPGAAGRHGRLAMALLGLAMTLFAGSASAGEPRSQGSKWSPARKKPVAAAEPITARHVARTGRPSRTSDAVTGQTSSTAESDSTSHLKWRPRRPGQAARPLPPRPASADVAGVAKPIPHPTAKTRVTSKIEPFADEISTAVGTSSPRKRASAKIVLTKATTEEPAEPALYAAPGNARPAAEASNLRRFNQIEELEPVPGDPSELDEMAEASGPPGEVNCSDEYKLLKPIGSLTNSINHKSSRSGPDVPEECPLAEDGFQPRAWAPLTYTWKASGLCHKPLYFEEVALERYGHSFHPLVQPFVSGAHFFAMVPILPYKMGMNPPWECIYPLGHDRPGNCVPYMFPPLPLSLRGALVQGGVVSGLVSGFP